MYALSPIDQVADGSEPCAQTDPDLFFPSNDVDEPEAVKRLCWSCPHRIECYISSMEAPVNPDGILAGINKARRTKLRRQRSLKARQLKEAATVTVSVTHTT